MDGLSEKTSSGIEGFCNALSYNPEDLVYVSMMSANVDSSEVQDGCTNSEQKEL